MFRESADSVTVGYSRPSHASLGLVKQNVSKRGHWVYPGGDKGLWYIQAWTEEWILWGKEMTGVRLGS